MISCFLDSYIFLHLYQFLTHWLFYCLINSSMYPFVIMGGKTTSDTLNPLSLASPVNFISDNPQKCHFSHNCHFLFFFLQDNKVESAAPISALCTIYCILPVYSYCIPTNTCISKNLFICEYTTYFKSEGFASSFEFMIPVITLV